MRADLETVLQKARTLDVSEVEEFLGDLERCRVAALSVLMRPAPPRADHLIGVTELAVRLGVSEDFVYRNKKRYAGFARPQGKKLLWSSSGLDQYLKKTGR